jgi:dipeptidyl aminopeptidase/acylaminoacyl peptidase
MFSTRSNRVRFTASVAVCALLLVVARLSATPDKKTLTFADLMRFRAIEKPVLADNGTVLAYALQPDRGDGEGIVRELTTGRTTKVPRGGSPIVSKDARWVAMAVKPTLAATEKAGKDKPKPGMALVSIAGGTTAVSADNVERFAFSDDSRWLAYLVTAAETAAPATEKTPAPAGAVQPSGLSDTKKKPAPTLHLRDLAAATEREVKYVSAFAFDPASKHLAYAVAEPEGKGNGLYVLLLIAAREATGTSVQIKADATGVAQAERAGYDSLTWTKDGGALAFVSVKDREKADEPATAWIWLPGRPQAAIAVANSQAPAGWMLPFKNELTWSKDGKSLFFGFKPMDRKAAAEAARKAAAHQAAMIGASPTPVDDSAAAKDKEEDLLDFDQILAKREVDVWHWNDPRIIPQQKLTWERDKDRTCRAVLHLAGAAGPSVVVLADRTMPEVAVPDNPRVALGLSDVPYLKETTWGERFRDVYAVDLATGGRKLIVSRLRDQATLSPDGRFAAYFADRQWRLYDTAGGTTRVLTSGIGVPLDEEEHDTPDTPPAYGLGGWVDDGAALLVYDRYDIWRIPAAGGPAVNLTGGEGRRRRVTFRVVTLDAEAKSVSSREPMLLTAYHEREKNWGFYSASCAKPGVDVRVDEKKLFKFVAKARKADVLLFTREDFGEFPDVWATDTAFRQPKKVTDANPQMADFAWGSAELVEYKSQDGVPLQGVLIKPANYLPGKRYPVITYFYERQSQRLYEFNEPVVNHRPSFSIYAGAGYAVFLPDIVFSVGHPGQSIVKCLVPAVQRLVDMGVADPSALGLHGHSWGGYGTAFVVTQTDMFKAAVAGAPVANMTSAYGGIRWESGLARQFQYEQSQSRIGGSLWEKRDLYLENSALFFADRVKTPLLIEHGDDDGAVPWYQGIELYLALRRLGKDCIFLQYRGEPHHLRKYPNKLDYSIRMKEYFDHYLKGAPAAEWIEKGAEYRGK